MYGYIYETTNLINGRRYIGQHRSPEFDPNYKGSGKYIWRAIRKYGWDNFEVKMLCPCFSQEELNAEEIDYIVHCDALNSDDYYNLRPGGYGGRESGFTQSIETRRKISEAMSGPDSPLAGKHLSAEHRKHISESNRGSRNSMYGKYGQDNPSYGKRRSEETRRKISEVMKGQKLSEAHKAKISNSMQGNTNRLIQCT